jgi:hypothetical protein
MLLKGINLTYSRSLENLKDRYKANHTPTQDHKHSGGKKTKENNEICQRRRHNSFKGAIVKFVGEFSNDCRGELEYIVQ